ncbi:MAG: hypothetical protein D6705_09930 [Deltaproteobacteria bacterium]|nr:MAG: hypothetical protein D6705_09930 [Deltaproteobacteria bacterium]
MMRAVPGSPDPPPSAAQLPRVWVRFATVWAAVAMALAAWLAVAPARAAAFAEGSEAAPQRRSKRTARSRRSATRTGARAAAAPSGDGTASAPPEPDGAAPAGASASETGAGGVEGGGEEGATASDGAVAASSAAELAALSPDDRAALLDRIRTHLAVVQAFAAGTLDEEHDLAEVFGVDLLDDSEVALEAARLRALLSASPDQAGVSAPSASSGADASAGTSPAPAAGASGTSPATGDGKSPSGEVAPGAAPPTGQGAGQVPADHGSASPAGQGAGQVPAESGPVSPPEAESRRASAGGKADAPTATGADVPPQAPARAPEEGSTEDTVAVRAILDAQRRLDAARLAVLELPKEVREALVGDYRARLADRGRAGEKDAEQARKEAEALESARQAALAAAEQARSEAVRLVAEEQARLLGILQAQSALRAEIAEARAGLSERTERLLALRRRVREVLDAKRPDEAAIEARFAEVSAELRRALDEFRASLREAFEEVEVPEPGPDRLSEIPGEIDRSEVDALRAKAQAAAEELRRDVAAYRRERVEAVHDELIGLNETRLELLGALPEASRSEVTGFSMEAFDWALFEMRSAAAQLRYGAVRLRYWITDLETSEGARGRSAFFAAILTFKWMLPILPFWWWRRRSPEIFQRLLAQRPRTPSGRRDLPYRVLAFVDRVRRPAEWLLLIAVLLALLPATAQDALEVRLVATTLRWTFGGTLIVRIVDALAATGEVSRRGAADVAALRLRSLMLVSRTVVAFGVTLSLTEQLVGRGTVYGWVFTICWFAAVPVGLVVLRWWRPVLLERIAVIRRKKPIHTWIMAHQTGLASMAAALLAAGWLTGKWVQRLVQRRFTEFDWVRRGLAWLFRRELDRMAAADDEGTRFSFLEREVFEALGPEEPARPSLDGPVARVREEIEGHIARIGGGIYAVVGERGAGKTTLLRAVAEGYEHAVLVSCPESGLAGLERLLAERVGSTEEGTLEASARALDARGDGSAVFIDDVHRLVRPVIGGFAEFDRLAAIARDHSGACAWFFAADAVLWGYFARARGTRPLFDEVVELPRWSEDEIVALVEGRTEAVGLACSFEPLMEKLPPDADEIDRAEALARAKSSYFRLLWDASDGNPGVALHMWRRSLWRDEKTGEVVVRPYREPRVALLESLPDPAVFVLRAVVQLEPATRDSIVEVTMLPAARVEDALRFARMHEIVRLKDGYYTVSWDWYRTLSRFLRRRHLLPGSMFA